jgi:hypothetical protein
MLAECNFSLNNLRDHVYVLKLSQQLDGVIPTPDIADTVPEH